MLRYVVLAPADASQTFDAAVEYAEAELVRRRLRPVSEGVTSEKHRCIFTGGLYVEVECEPIADPETEIPKEVNS